MSQLNIAIIGGGLSGTLLAVQLLKQRNGPANITLYQAAGRPAGLGIAYSTTCPSHLLNVPAGKMSAFPDAPDDFYQWAKQNTKHPRVLPTTFLPRRDYGHYIQAILEAERQQAHPQITFNICQTTIKGLSWQEGQKHWQLTDSKAIEHCANVVILAMGNAPQALPSAIEMPIAGHPQFIQNPWAHSQIQQIQNNETVFILGTGLTMVDKLLELQYQGHQGPIFALSRRGLLPQCHQLDDQSMPFTPEAVLSKTPLALFRKLKKESIQAPWRSLVDGLRPHTKAIWQNWPRESRSSFMRHLATFWEVHRHRMAPEIAKQLLSAKASGQCKILAGRVQEYQPETDKHIQVIYKARGQSETQRIQTHWVINCAGAGQNFALRQDPLIHQLIQTHHAQLSDFQLGFQTTPEGHLVFEPGFHKTGIYAIGPLQKGQLWESTAVPEIRQQAQHLAQHIIQTQP